MRCCIIINFKTWSNFTNSFMEKKMNGDIVHDNVLDDLEFVPRKVGEYREVLGIGDYGVAFQTESISPALKSSVDVFGGTVNGLLDHVASVLKFAQTIAKEDGEEALTDDEQSALIGRLEKSVALLERSDPDAVPDDEDAGNLEAIISSFDRPALLVRNGGILLDDPQAIRWRDTLERNMGQIKRTIGSVGRINLNGQQVGTGYVIAPGLIMTNVHVAVFLAEKATHDAIVRHGESGFRRNRAWAVKPGVSIDFKEGDGMQGRLQFRVKEPFFIGPLAVPELMDTTIPDRIKIARYKQSMNLSNMDMAIFEVETTNADGRSLPPALSLSSQESLLVEGKDLFVVGYPGRTVIQPTDAEADKKNMDLLRYFNGKFGVKRLSPGQIVSLPGSNIDDKGNWVVSHDSSTLGGNSGSCVVPLNENEDQVLALHFGGGWYRSNFSIALPKVRNILKAVRAHWV
ncbi:hypothetical protein M2352_003864 [Azospirillum fermentarium]|uniref:trypsin-like peptidase domain-containing protein n=1 Tax=Azospirillum fermentarium TaxID=1233114 RepID=UPI0022274128|nr:trypsin-like peptidase domain-containing protein [Azospirillum fermentarium]MCW2248230.1 hypothetical protein [Azospirillum fermentarium]